jgi:ElaB/YqjD/DUF883 family membrane-anchored ribosome-binding protein
MARRTKENQEALMSDLQDALSDTEAMLSDIASDGGQMAKDLRQKLTENLQNVKAKLIETEELVTEKAKFAAKATDDYVRENPWQSIGVAVGVGFLVGMLVSRR